MAVLGYARVGKGRLGAFRLGFYQPWLKVLVNGVDRTLHTRIAGASIVDELNHAPNTVRLRCDGFTPVQGQSVVIYIGDTNIEHQVFGGHILDVAALYELKPANLAFDVNCIDYTWLLNRRKVIKKYTSSSATAIIQDLISTYTSGFTSVNVTAGLASLDEITFTNEEVTDAITRVMERVGGYWYVDYAKDVHAFLTDTETAGPITQAAPRGMSDIQQHVDLSQVATRVTARGGGSNASVDIFISGTPTLPVETGEWYSASGGAAEIGQQRIAYTGVAGTADTGSTTGYIAPPPASFTVGPEGSAGAMDPSALYGYALTYTTPEGETTPSAIVYGMSHANGTARVDNIPVPTDPKITLKTYYRTDGGGSTLKKLGSTSIATTTLAPDNTADASLTTAPPTSNTAGAASEAVAAGATSIQVENLSVFPASGWADVGGQIFSYTGRSATSGPGTLTGIPASGTGSITASVRSGTVRSVPHLTGVTGIINNIFKGDPVNVIVTVNDATAQTAMATWIGSGDGVHEMFITDGRWSLTEATNRANAELTMRKDPLVTISFKSRDQTIQSGRDITITLSSPSISGTFKIQRVTFSEIGFGGARNTLYPLRTVECSSRRFSFEDLLRQIKSKAA